MSLKNFLLIFALGGALYACSPGSDPESYAAKCNALFDETIECFESKEDNATSGFSNCVKTSEEIADTQSEEETAKKLQAAQGNVTDDLQTCLNTEGSTHKKCYVEVWTENQKTACVDE